MHQYTVLLALASVSLVITLGAVYLCRVEWAKVIEELVALRATPWDDWHRWADGLERIRLAATASHRLSAVAVGCTLVSGALTWAATLRLCEARPAAIGGVRRARPPPPHPREQE